jgi:rhamnose transport system permease protein
LNDGSATGSKTSGMTRYKRELSVLAAYLLLLLVLLVRAPSFYDRQFFDTWVSASVVLVVAVGMTLVIVARQIDISVGSQFSACAVLAALAARHGVPIPLALSLAVVAGAAFGAVNGAFVAFLKLPSIVVTLATLVILAESLAWAREGEAVRDLPANFQWLGLPQSAGEVVLLLVGLTVFAAAAWATRYLAAGRTPYAVGSDAEAARLAGIRPARVVYWTFVLTGALAGLAGALEAVRQPQVATNLGKDLELKVIAAVVVGGTAVTGGRGTLLGTLVGVALLSSVRPTLSFLGLSADWEKAAQGAIILLAVGSEGLLRARGRRGGGRVAATAATAALPA